jgi:hypothetical protein
LETKNKNKTTKEVFIEKTKKIEMIEKQEMREKKRILKAEEKPKSQGSEETKCKETGK